MKKVSKFIGVFVLMSFVYGCATVPAALPLKDGMLNEFTTSQNVSIVNVASTPDLEEWTNSVISFLAKQLEKRGATVSDVSPKVLKIEIVEKKQNGLYAYWAYKCYITLKVKTGDGYVNEYAVDDVSGLSLQRACNFSITKAVAAILNDQKIREYLGLL